MAENPQAVDKIRSGDIKAIDFLVGQTMKKTGGKADAKKAKRLICTVLKVEQPY
jgi:Asp-tRNA(Asn)/Glu-tRNA(Gln) amidotransferase B subunit